MITITAVFLYSGLIDYWSGDGNRWDDNKGCLFASFDRHTTLRQLINELVQDFRNGDLDDKEPWADVTDEQIRSALLEMLTDRGRDDYRRNRLCEFAKQLDKGDYPDDYDGELPQVIVLVIIESEVPNDVE